MIMFRLQCGGVPVSIINDTSNNNTLQVLSVLISSLFINKHSDRYIPWTIQACYNGSGGCNHSFTQDPFTHFISISVFYSQSASVSACVSILNRWFTDRCRSKSWRQLEVLLASAQIGNLLTIFFFTSSNWRNYDELYSFFGDGYCGNKRGGEEQDTVLWSFVASLRNVDPTSS
jgi:hypothetical protein